MYKCISLLFIFYIELCNKIMGNGDYLHVSKFWSLYKTDKDIYWFIEGSQTKGLRINMYNKGFQINYFKLRAAVKDFCNIEKSIFCGICFMAVLYWHIL